MKAAARYIMAIVFASVVTIYMAATLGAGAAKRHGTSCSGLNIVIRDSLRNRFVTREDVKSYLDMEKIGYIGMKAGEIDLVKIERAIDSKSAVLKSEAYMTRDGLLNIEVTQRTPVVQFRKNGGGFYSDADGYLFPLQRHNPDDILYIDGNVPLRADSGYKGEAGSQEEKKWLDGILGMISYIDGHSWLSGKIARMSVLGNGDIVIYPVEGREKFIFGSPDNIDIKFKRIRYYYSEIVPEKGSGTYSSVNVKYDGQVICRK
ncbi:MAG: hypothetical protein K2J62_07395 [Bacteroidales bacterium]|nr:hypothetical protein [Bacteroidales bacterium]